MHRHGSGSRAGNAGEKCDPIRFPREDPRCDLHEATTDVSIGLRGKMSR